MSKTKIVIIATSVALTGAAALRWRSYEREIIERFPFLEPKLCRKTYRKMMRVALSGGLNGVPTDTDEQMDEVFLDIYETLKTK